MARQIPSKKDVLEANNWIREHQLSRAFAFPADYAPDGRLREATTSHYMSLMKLYYQYNKEDDLSLELMQEKDDGSQKVYAKVGQVYSADFVWEGATTIRLHIIAARKNFNMVVEHYHVYDIGEAGVAYTLPRRAWDNWRMWPGAQVEGIHKDKRILYMILGDRSQITNMTLERFSRLTLDQVKSLQDRMEPGLFLVRPTLEEAGLDEGPVQGSPPPVIELSSSSGSGSDPKSPEPEKQKEDLANTTGTSASHMIMTRGRLSRGSKHQADTHRNLFIIPPKLQYKAKDKPAANGPTFIHAGPDGPLAKETVDGIGALLSECLQGPSLASTQIIATAEKLARMNMAEEDRRFDAYEDPDESVIEVNEDEEEEEFEEETSVEESRDCSGMFEMSGVSSLGPDESRATTSSADWDGPLPMDDSVEVFLAKKLNKSQVINISTDSSVLEVSKGQASDTSGMDF